MRNGLKTAPYDADVTASHRKSAKWVLHLEISETIKINLCQRSSLVQSKTPPVIPAVFFYYRIVTPAALSGVISTHATINHSI
jgi:hypothetical protein